MNTPSVKVTSLSLFKFIKLAQSLVEKAAPRRKSRARTHLPCVSGHSGSPSHLEIAARDDANFLAPEANIIASAHAPSLVSVAENGRGRDAYVLPLNSFNGRGSERGARRGAAAASNISLTAAAAAVKLVRPTPKVGRCVQGATQWLPD